jgi:hypothetical protein
VRLSRVFSHMGLSYREHTARPKRRQEMLTRGPAQSQTLTEMPSTCSMGAGVGGMLRGLSCGSGRDMRSRWLGA